MSYIQNISSSSIIDSVLTRSGRRKMASDLEEFKPMKFAFCDDDINYKLLNPDNIDQDDPDIISLPIAEPSTNDANEVIHKIWVNSTFLNNRFGAPEQAQGQYVYVTSNVGDQPILYSDDTVNKSVCWFNTFNALDRPTIGAFYRLKFTDTIDYYTVQFVSPVLSDTMNNNWTKISDTEYVFNAQNFDGSGRYERTNTGAPSVVFHVRFRQTPQFYADVQKPENRQSIKIVDFATISEVDASRALLPEVRSATMSLLIKNNII